MPPFEGLRVVKFTPNFVNLKIIPNSIAISRLQIIPCYSSVNKREVFRYGHEKNTDRT